MRILKKFTLRPKQVFDYELAPKIFFLHIPKCGGTSISHAIQKSINLNKQFYGQPFFSLDSSVTRKCANLFEDDLNEYRLRILAYQMSISHCKYIHGHFNFSSKIFQEFSDKWNFITILRHPVDQWFSQYFYDTRSDSEVPILCDLDSFIDTERARMMGNAYVRKLTDNAFSSDAFTNDVIQLAIANLSKFALVGVLEKLDVFAGFYNKLFKRSISFDRHNVSPLPKVKQQEVISENLVNKVTEICQPNFKVYKHALNQSNILAEL